jgi:hypothetical protein
MAQDMKREMPAVMMKDSRTPAPATPASVFASLGGFVQLSEASMSAANSMFLMTTKFARILKKEDLKKNKYRWKKSESRNVDL